VKSFANILTKSKRSPKALQTDKGKGFVNKFFQKWLKHKKIHFFTTHNEETKACVVERFNRTLKTRTWRYFTAKNTRKYLNILQGLVHNYNPSFHRSIKRTPASVSLENQKVWQTLYGSASSVKLPKIAQGSLVKISKVKGFFHKGYLPNWSEENFLVKYAKAGSPPTHVL